MLQVKHLDFTGVQLFCGIDVHKKNWSVCLRDEERELKTFSQDADPHLLIQFLRKSYPNAIVTLVYEAGFCGFWPQQAFAEQGFQCLVVAPSEVPQSDSDRRYKTDIVDCRKLALSLSKGLLRSIYIPQPAWLAYRTLVRSRAQLVKEQTRYKNRIISFLDFYGIHIPAGYKSSSHFSRRFIQWLQALDLDDHTKLTLCSQLNILGALRAELMAVNAHFKQLAQQPLLASSVALLRSIPGVGLVAALTLLTELEDISRFRSLDHLASFAGFKPDVYASAEKQVHKGITHHCNHRIREALVECAWMAISKDPALTLAYKTYKQRMHYNKAILRIAKKLLSRLRHLLLHQQPYQLGQVAG